MAGNLSTKKRLLIASDHAGFAVKKQLIETMPQFEWVDLGPQDDERVDYPDFADQLARRVLCDGGQGVLICGSGQGMAMRANRYPGIRAALAWSEDSARLAREHNNANVICFGARLLPVETIRRLIEIFVSTPFEGGRHVARVEKLDRGI